MPKEGVSLPKLSISVFMIIRLVLLIIDCIIIGIIGYYFSYSRGSFRQNLFHEEIMMLVCSIFAFVTTVTSVVNILNKSRVEIINDLTLQMNAAAISPYNGYSEIISNCMTSFLLTLSSIVLLIQVRLSMLILFDHSFSQAVYIWKIFGNPLWSKSVWRYTGPCEWYILCYIFSVYL